MAARNLMWLISGYTAVRRRVASGRGEMWRKQGGREEVVPVGPGVCVTIPLGTHFQFRSFGDEPLAAVGVTIPPWPAMMRHTGLMAGGEPTAL
jgi:hypothetical protein